MYAPFPISPDMENLQGGKALPGQGASRESFLKVAGHQHPQTWHKLEMGQECEAYREAKSCMDRAAARRAMPSSVHSKPMATMATPVRGSGT